MSQRPISAAAVNAGYASVLAGLHARNPGVRYSLVPLDGTRGAGGAGGGDGESARVVGPDHHGAVGDRGASVAGHASYEDVTDRSLKEVA